MNSKSKCMIAAGVEQRTVDKKKQAPGKFPELVLLYSFIGNSVRISYKAAKHDAHGFCKVERPDIFSFSQGLQKSAANMPYCINESPKRGHSAPASVFNDGTDGFR